MLQYFRRKGAKVIFHQYALRFRQKLKKKISFFYSRSFSHTMMPPHHHLSTLSLFSFIFTARGLSVCLRPYISSLLFFCYFIRLQIAFQPLFLFRCFSISSVQLCLVVIRKSKKWSGLSILYSLTIAFATLVDGEQTGSL